MIRVAAIVIKNDTTPAVLAHVSPPVTSRDVNTPTPAPKQQQLPEGECGTALR